MRKREEAREKKEKRLETNGLERGTEVRGQISKTRTQEDVHGTDSRAQESSAHSIVYGDGGKADERGRRRNMK